MRGDSGKMYWGGKAVDDEEKKVKGIVVVFGWLSSQETYLKKYAQLYSSMGWDSLVCHPDTLNLWFPEKASSLASAVLNELIKLLKVSPRPVVFAAFSGGPKTCMYKVLQIIDGKCGSQQNNSGDYQLVRNCISGHMYDSCPIDVTADIWTSFVLHPDILKMSHPPRIMSWIASGIAYCLDTLFANRFKAERADYWQTLYASVNMKAPFLLLCSEDDGFAAYPTICSFAQRLQDLGGDVKLVTWNSSPHVAHYRKYPADYKAAVVEFFEKAILVHSRKLGKLEGGRAGIERNHVVVLRSERHGNVI